MRPAWDGANDHRVSHTIARGPLYRAPSVSRPVSRAHAPQFPWLHIYTLCTESLADIPETGVRGRKVRTRAVPACRHVLWRHKKKGPESHGPCARFFAPHSCVCVSQHRTADNSVSAGVSQGTARDAYPSVYGRVCALHIPQSQFFLSLLEVPPRPGPCAVSLRRAYWRTGERETRHSHNFTATGTVELAEHFALSAAVSVRHAQGVL